MIDARDQVQASVQSPHRKRSKASLTALRQQFVVNTPNFALSQLQRLARCMNRVIAQDEIMRMRDCRTDHELGGVSRDKLHPRLAGLEDDDISVARGLGHIEVSLAHGQPQDGVSARRLVLPALAEAERYSQVIDRGGSNDGTPGAAIRPEQQARRPDARNIGGA